MKKKILAVVLAGMLGLGAVACSGGGSGTASEGTASEASS